MSNQNAFLNVALFSVLQTLIAVTPKNKHLQMVKKYFSIFFYCVRGKARERFCDPLLSGNSVNF